MAFLKVLEDGSHMIMMECPDAVNTLLHEFFLWEPATPPPPKKDSKTRPESAKPQSDHTNVTSDPSKVRPATANQMTKTRNDWIWKLPWWLHYHGWPRTLWVLIIWAGFSCWTWSCPNSQRLDELRRDAKQGVQVWFLLYQLLSWRTEVDGGSFFSFEAPCPPPTAGKY